MGKWTRIKWMDGWIVVRNKDLLDGWMLNRCRVDGWMDRCTEQGFAGRMDAG